MKIYADHAATTKLDFDAFEAMKPFLLEEYGNASEPYSFARSAKTALKTARETIAGCINAEPDEIIFTSGGTESDNWALKSSVFVPDERRGIITSRIEHHAILNTCLAIREMGYPVQYLPTDNKGIVHPESLELCNMDAVRLVSVMLANNEIGTIQPVKKLCEIAHSRGALFHTDAVQAVGHIPVDVKELGVDMLSASAHKFNGPKGIGFLYLKKGIELASYANGGAQEFGKRAGTENVASIAGMAAALEKNCRMIHENARHLYNLEEMFLDSLNKTGIRYIRNGSDNRIPGNMSLSFENSEGEMLLHRLDLMGICVSTGSACDSQNTQISHVLQAIHVPEQYAKGTIRISLGRDNTEEDVRTIALALSKILKG